MSTREVSVPSSAEQSPQIPPQKTKKKPEAGRKKKKQGLKWLFLKPGNKDLLKLD